MGHLIRLRISLADRAGALGQAATVIGLHGGNIMAIDVHHTGGNSAVDDVVVEFATEPDLQVLQEDLAINAATTLISHEATQVIDPLVTCLGGLVKRLETGLGDPADALAEGVAELCSSPAAWISTTSEASRYEAGRLALERNGPVAVRSTEHPQLLAGQLSGEFCLLAVPDVDRLDGGRVVFVARPAITDFTATEIARIEALVALHNQIQRLARTIEVTDATGIDGTGARHGVTDPR